MRPYLIALLLPLTGCAGHAAYLLYDAEKAYDRALEAGGQERAPYESEMARAFLMKSKEEVNGSDFGAAVTLAKKAKEWSGEAYLRATDEGRPDVSGADEFVPEIRVERPKEANDTLDIDLDD